MLRAVFAMSMRHVLTWQYDNSDDGADVPTYTTYLKNWPCEIVQVSGGETFRGKQIESQVTAVIEGRWVNGATSAMRLYDEVRERYFHIQRIFELEGRRHNIQVHATESAGEVA